MAKRSQLLNLFLLYTNYKLLSSVNKQEAQVKYNEYLAALAQAKMQGLFRLDDFPNQKLEALGWE